VTQFEKDFNTLADNVKGFVLGQSKLVDLALVCLFAEGHLLIEGMPGLAKTSLARTIARSIKEVKSKRIQFTPDLLPADLTGSRVYRQSVGSAELAFEEGPVFCNVLLGDEINRASPKTQSALLEAMGERQVTVDGETRRLDGLFICVATQNPIEHHGTYPLPEAQLDRFMMKLFVDYPPDPATEAKVIMNGALGRTPDKVQDVLSLSRVVEMIDEARAIRLPEETLNYIVEIVRNTRRKGEHIERGVSPRGAIALAAAAKARAAATGGTYATAADVQYVAPAVLCHRLVLKDSVSPDVTVESKIAQIIRDLNTPENRRQRALK
jgi:MoxR-like ATPase